MQASNHISKALTSIVGSQRGQPHGLPMTGGQTATPQQPRNLPTVLPPPLPPSIEQGVYLAMNSLDQIARDMQPEAKGLKPILEQEITRLDMLLQPAHRQDIMKSLARLILHCPMSNMGANEQAELFRDYLDDLAPYPLNFIQDACTEYRLNRENRFFPTAAVLVDAVKAKCLPLQRKRATIEKLLCKL